MNNLIKIRHKCIYLYFLIFLRIPIPMLEAMQKLEDEMKMSVDDDTDSVEPTAEIDLDALVSLSKIL